MRKPRHLRLVKPAPKKKTAARTEDGCLILVDEKDNVRLVVKNHEIQNYRDILRMTYAISCRPWATKELVGSFILSAVSVARESSQKFTGDKDLSL